MEVFHSFTLFILMNAGCQKNKYGIADLYIKGSQVEISKLWCISVINICSYICKQCRPDEMPHDATFHLGFPCLQKYLFAGIQI